MFTLRKATSGAENTNKLASRKIQIKQEMPVITEADARPDTNESTFEQAILKPPVKTEAPPARRQSPQAQPINTREFVPKVEFRSDGEELVALATGLKKPQPPQNISNKEEPLSFEAVNEQSLKNNDSYQVSRDESFKQVEPSSNDQDDVLGVGDRGSDSNQFYGHFVEDQDQNGLGDTNDDAEIASNEIINFEREKLNDYDRQEEPLPEVLMNFNENLACNQEPEYHRGAEADVLEPKPALLVRPPPARPPGILKPKPVVKNPFSNAFNKPRSNYAPPEHNPLYFEQNIDQLIGSDDPSITYIEDYPLKKEAPRPPKPFVTHNVKALVPETVKPNYVFNCSFNFDLQSIQTFDFKTNDMTAVKTVHLTCRDSRLATEALLSGNVDDIASWVSSALEQTSSFSKILKNLIRQLANRSNKPFTDIVMNEIRVISPSLALSSGNCSINDESVPLVERLWNVIIREDKLLWNPEYKSLISVYETNNKDKLADSPNYMLLCIKTRRLEGLGDFLLTDDNRLVFLSTILANLKYFNPEQSLYGLSYLCESSSNKDLKLLCLLSTLIVKYERLTEQFLNFILHGCNSPLLYLAVHMYFLQKLKIDQQPSLKAYYMLFLTISLPNAFEVGGRRLVEYHIKYYSSNRELIAGAHQDIQMMASNVFSTAYMRYYRELLEIMQDSCAKESMEPENSEKETRDKPSGLFGIVNKIWGKLHVDKPVEADQNVDIDDPMTEVKSFEFLKPNSPAIEERTDNVGVNRGLVVRPPANDEDNMILNQKLYQKEPEQVAAPLEPKLPTPPPIKLIKPPVPNSSLQRKNQLNKAKFVAFKG